MTDQDQHWLDSRGFAHDPEYDEWRCGYVAIIAVGHRWAAAYIDHLSDPIGEGDTPAQAVLALKRDAESVYDDAHEALAEAREMLREIQRAIGTGSGK